VNPSVAGSASGRFTALGEVDVARGETASRCVWRGVGGIIEAVRYDSLLPQAVSFLPLGVGREFAGLWHIDIYPKPLRFG
jgi:hypothetical protein